MDDGRRLYDTAEQEQVMNELLITIVAPAITFFVALWASFRLIFNDLLLSVGLAPIEPAIGWRTLSSGAGRLFLLITLTTVLLLPYLVLYLRVFRAPLKERGLV